MSNNSRLDLTVLDRHARTLHQLAADAKTDPKDGVPVVSYDAVHDTCRAVLGHLALAGHKRSADLLAVRGVTGDSGAALSREAALVVGSIGI